MPRYRDLTRNETNIKHTPWEADSLMSGQSEYLDPNPSKAGAGRGKQGGPTVAQLKAQDVEDTRASVEKARAEKKGVSVDQMRKDMSDEYDRKMKAGEFYKKGGSVKGWGAARGARKAKVY
jgi:hypothetical protein